MKKIFIILLFSLSACSDQIEANYKTFEAAKQDNFFQKGWIPNELVYKSMKNIFLMSNVDTNSAIFYFSLSKMDLAKTERKLQLNSNQNIEIKSLEIPLWWENKIEDLPKFTLEDETNFKVNIAINKNTNEIFGWRDDH